MILFIQFKYKREPDKGLANLRNEVRGFFVVKKGGWMPIADKLIKDVTGYETKNYKLSQAAEVMLRRILEGMGLNIKSDTKAKSIQGQMKLASIRVVHIVDEPGKPINNQIPSGYWFYKNNKLAHILKEPFMENGEVIIEQGRVS